MIVELPNYFYETTGMQFKKPRARPFESLLSLKTGCSWRGYSFVYGFYLLCSLWGFYNRTEWSLPDGFFFFSFLCQKGRLWRWILDLNSPIEESHVTVGSISEAHLHKILFPHLDGHFRTNSDNKQEKYFTWEKLNIWVKLISSNQFQQIHLCFSMSFINILLLCGGLFIGLQSCFSHRCFMSRFS